MNNFIPVVVIVFNRPDLVDALFASIRKYAPRKIYIIADGARIGRAGESELCEETRRKAVANVDWDCQLIMLFSEVNLGCRNRIVTGLDEVFTREDNAIILEDDTLPNDDFFLFCSENLEKYRNDPTVLSITGSNIWPSLFQRDIIYFSKYTHIWGWATWKRSWLLYDSDLSFLDDASFLDKMRFVLGAERHYKFWLKLLRSVRRREIDTWDYQLQATAWAYGAYCITPGRNLITNIGFRPDATHTHNPSIFSNKKRSVFHIKSNWPIASGFATICYDYSFRNVFHNPNSIVRRMRLIWAHLIKHMRR